MLGLRNLTMDRLTTAFMVVSAAMIVFAVALAPADSASTTAFVLWIAGSLVHIGLWLAVATEIFRRLFRGGARDAATPRDHRYNAGP